MDEAEARQGEVGQSHASTSGVEGTVQRLRDLRMADRQYVLYFQSLVIGGAIHWLFAPDRVWHVQSNLDRMQTEPG